MKTLGLNVGSSSIKIAVLEDGKLIHSAVKAHDGNVKETLEPMLKEAGANPGIRMMITGTEGRKQFVGNSVIEGEAIQELIVRKYNDVNAYISVGGEDLVVYKVEDAKIINSLSGNKCASGTGEFFKQQLKRMNFDLDDGIKEAHGCEVHKISSRCSVFMKSDCTHKLNKNEASKGDIVLSLSNVMAQKVMEFVKKSRINNGKIILAGGVTANPHFVKMVKEELEELDVIVPENSRYFEALGAAYLAETKGSPMPEYAQLFTSEHVSYETMAPLSQFKSKVSYMKSIKGKASADAEYILGVDGGSTTTKVALINLETNEIVAQHYGRTHGDPVAALKLCMLEIKKQLQEEIGTSDIKISIVATTGSSREILGVFSQTNAVYNEIIAHSAGTMYFDKEIDTIFEIGGQDAKYVLLKNGVPIDYAMNEACSAGTGSFLEEAAKGDLNIHDPAEIGPAAELSDAPLKFGEHCSAFINSDIRKAIQEGASKGNIVAGLVYSVVLNYVNRVVGNRRVGNKIVIQGGVAMNSAIPLAIASLVNKEIIVPPHPELMGCFGVAMIAKRKLEEGEIEKKSYTIESIFESEISYEGEFVCKSCDNLCSINRLKVNGDKYFFGGRCNKYANTKKKSTAVEEAVDYVEMRTQMVFKDFAAKSPEKPLKDILIGVPKTFSVHSLWPLYSNFFAALGVRFILSDTVQQEGIAKVEAPYCFPGEIAHGMMEDLLDKKCDYYFLPHFQDMPSNVSDTHATTCPITQGLPYYIRTAFNIPDEKILRPFINFGDGFKKGAKTFVKLAQSLGFSASLGKKAYGKGLEAHHAYIKKAQEVGKKALAEAEAKDGITIVLFGRPYNAFTSEANMGIPRKFISRNYTLIPFEFLPSEDEEIYENQYYYFSQSNLKSAVHISKNPKLYMCYITNFSCGPDSFILHYMRWIHGEKPFLILELDSHTADAGVDTRVEAFLDIVEGYRRSGNGVVGTHFDKRYQLDVEKGKKVEIIDTQTNAKVALTDNRVKLLWASMGHESSEAMAAITRKQGIDSQELPISDVETVTLARAVASGKECIPTLLVLGSFIKYFQTNEIDPNKIYVLFMPITTGPCRTGQYAVYFERILREMGYNNFAILRLNSDNSYSEMGSAFSKDAWHGVIAGDYIKDIQTMTEVCAEDWPSAQKLIRSEWQKVLKVFEAQNMRTALYPALEVFTKALKTIPLKRDPKTVKKVMVVGEIFVRRDDYSVSPLIDRLSSLGIASKKGGLTEWIHYTDYGQEQVLLKKLSKLSVFKRYTSKVYKDYLALKLEMWWKRNKQNKQEQILEKSGLLPKSPEDMSKIMRWVNEFSHPQFLTEASVSPCVAAQAMAEDYSGVVIISPFACLAGRLIEAIYTPWAREKKLPVIALENDGNVYPPNVMAKIDIFALNVLEYTKEGKDLTPKDEKTAKKVAKSVGKS